jgi:hypothetical protein
MATLVKRQIRRGSTEYRIEISLDYEALLQSEIHTSVTGAVRRVGDEKWDEVTYDIDVDLKAKQVVVKYGDKTVATFPLGLSLPESPDPDGEDIDIEVDDGIIDGAIQVAHSLDLSVAEHLLQALPVPDPFLGCLLKSAITTTVGQIIRCWNSQKIRKPLKYLASQMAECLGAHKWAMFATFMARSGRCMVFCGLS